MRITIDDYKDSNWHFDDLIEYGFEYHKYYTYKIFKKTLNRSKNTLSYKEYLLYFDEMGYVDIFCGDEFIFYGDKYLKISDLLKSITDHRRNLNLSKLL